jgi:hypothetical protein
MASPSKVELKDFDDPLIFNEFEKALNRYESRNFVLEFDGDHACGAFDLDENSIEELLRERNAASEVISMRPVCKIPQSIGNLILLKT